MRNAPSRRRTRLSDEARGRRKTGSRGAQAARGGVYLSRSLEERMSRRLSAVSVVDEPLKRLTEREFEVLQLIAQD